MQRICAEDEILEDRWAQAIERESEWVLVKEAAERRVEIRRCSRRNGHTHLRNASSREAYRQWLAHYVSPIGPIIAVVEDALRGRRGAQQLSKWINKRRLRLDIDNAVGPAMKTRREVSRNRPWAARRKHVERSVESLRKTAAFAFGRDVSIENLDKQVLLDRTDEASFLDNSISEATKNPMLRQMRKAMEALEAMARELRASEESVTGDVGRDLGATEWLIGERLALIYEKRVRLRTGNQADTPFVYFVVAVLNYAGLPTAKERKIISQDRERAAKERETIFQYRKRAKARLTRKENWYTR